MAMREERTVPSRSGKLQQRRNARGARRSGARPGAREEKRIPFARRDGRSTGVGRPRTPRAALVGVEAEGLPPLTDAEVDELLASPMPGGISGTTLAQRRAAAGADLLQRYFASVEQHGLLTPQQELAFARRYVRTQDPAAKERLINSNLRLAAKIAYRYRNAFPDLLDLIQEANVGLVRAVDRYDPERGVRFTTYAAFWIRATVIRFILTHARNVRVKTHKPGERRGPAHEVSIDAPLDAHAVAGESGTFGEMLADGGPGPEELAIDGEYSAKLDENMSEFTEGLDERDRYIFEQRFGGDERLSLRDLGAKIGICQERVRQLEHRLVRRARAHLQTGGLIPER